jgi:uncharacterized membrane protein YfcA
MTTVQIILSLLSGGIVGLSLGLIGGGGSVLAVPLMVYVVGASSPHEAIGTSAVAVATSALINLIGHARDRNVKWPCATVFAVAGIAGAALGAEFGKAVNGAKLLAGFGVLMIAIALLMLRPKHGGNNPEVHLDQISAPRLLPPLAGTGFGVGALSGFFGIGGGFLIVPGLVTATSMPLLNAIGSSLVSVTAFGATTAVSYALSGLVNWPMAFLFIAGSTSGGFVGIRLARQLAPKHRALTLVFSGVVIAVGIYVVAKGVSQFL